MHTNVIEQHRARLRRAENILDRWLDLFEANLENARPDPTKTTEFTGVFTICHRILQIETALDKLESDASKDFTDGLTELELDSGLFARGLHPTDPQD